MISCLVAVFPGAAEFTGLFISKFKRTLFFLRDFILQTGEENKEDMTDYKVIIIWFVKSGTKLKLS